MKTIVYDNKDEWMQARLGKITGSKVKKIKGNTKIPKTAIIEELTALDILFNKNWTIPQLEKLLPEISYKKLANEVPKKIGYYQLIADRIAKPDDGELKPIDHGLAYEGEALERFAKETGLKVDTRLLLWEREDNPSIAYSPDGVVDKPRAVEVKCLSSANHIQALLTQRVPEEHEDQVIQAFVVNDDLSILYFVFYDPRMQVKDFFYLIVKREDVQKKVDKYLEDERKMIAEVNEIANELMGF